jgi:dienelactone hydrolase
VFLALAIVVLFLKYGLPYLTPRGGITTQLGSEPYALDDASARSRVADGWRGDALPALKLAPRGDGLKFAAVKLPVPADQPGYSSDLSIYEPEGEHAPKSLGCVLTTPSGGYLIASRGPPRSGDETEWLPYVDAGFAVVAFSNDGEVDPQNASRSEGNAAADKFFAAQAGLVNARQALEFVLARMPEVDPKRIYVAGNGAAGTLALLWAEHEPRLRACIAGAPITDVPRTVERFKKQGVDKLPDEMRTILQATSPQTHVAKFDCPVLLLHSATDDAVPVAESHELAGLLQQQGKDVTLVELPPGERNSVMLAAGIPRGVEWLRNIDQPGPAANPNNVEAAGEPKPGTDVAKTPATDPTRAVVVGVEQRKQETAWANWLWSAERLRDRLAMVTAGAQASGHEIKVAGHMASSLAEQSRTLVPARAPASLDAQPSPATLAEETRAKLGAVNASLESELQRISGFEGRDPARLELLTQLTACIVPAWVLEGRVSSSAEQAAWQEALARVDALRAVGRARDYRAEAARAMTWGKPRDAMRLLCAEVLAGDDKSLVQAVRWLPALARPAALVHWSYGVELNGFPGTGPENLQGPAAEAQKSDTGTQWRLSDQMKSLTGDVGI